MNYNEFMSKLILALTLILSLGFTTTSVADGQLSEHLHDIDYSGLSDANICSWFQVVPVPEDYINEAKKRGLTCSGKKYSTNNETNKSASNQEAEQNIKIPIGAIAGGGTSWYCEDDRYRNKSKTACIRVPENARKISVSNFKCNSDYETSSAFPPTCIQSSSPAKNIAVKNLPQTRATSYNHQGKACLQNYKKSGSQCIYLISIPSNAFASNAIVGWSCNNGFYKNGSYCKGAPQNSIVLANGSGFDCNSGYEKSGMSCISIYGQTTSIPKNGYQYGSTFRCVNGYTKSGNLCVSVSKVKIPSNAHASNATVGWSCNNGFYKDANRCRRAPQNSFVLADGSNFGCNSGYIKSRFICVAKEVKIPPNAYAFGSGWKCNSGFEKSGNSCIEAKDDTIYRAGSGTGFATTFDGHILTNHHVIDGCSEVTVHNKGRSYITTVISQDPKNDLAILISDFKPSKIYTLSTEVYLSDDIYAAGFPFGKRISSSITVNRGIVSALMGPGDDISKFQIDADINSGNSGGPIVDKKGNAIGIAVSKLNREKALEELGSVPEGFNFAVNSMMAIGLFRSQGIDLQEQNNSELSVKDRNDLFNQGTFYLDCGMTTAQYEKMAKTDKVMFTREVFFSDFQGN